MLYWLSLFLFLMMLNDIIISSRSHSRLMGSKKPTHCSGYSNGRTVVVQTGLNLPPVSTCHCILLLSTLAQQVAPLRSICKTAQVSVNFCGIHWTCLKLTHSLIWHKWMCSLLYWISLLFFSNFLSINRLWGSDGALTAQSTFLTGEWDVCFTIHSRFLGVILLGSLIWFQEMRVFSPSFCLCLCLCLFLLTLLPSLPLWLLFIQTDRSGE